jgi:hypothetical protein
MKKQTKKMPLPNLRDAYKVSGFRIQSAMEAYDFETCRVFILTLHRRAKKQCAVGVPSLAAAFTTRAGGVHAILDAAIGKSISILKCAA